MKLANFSLLIFLVASASAFHIPFEHRAPGTAPSGLVERARSLNTNGNYQFNQSGGACVGEITLDGQKFEVQLSTVFGDLWLSSDGNTFPSATHTNQSVPGLNGTQILIGSLKFGDWAIKDQAFITEPHIAHTLGLGPQNHIGDALGGTQYNNNTFLDNVFKAHPDEPIFTFLFSRDDRGNLTIGTLLEGHESITSTPKFSLIDIFTWGTFMDEAIINGTRYSGKDLGFEGDTIQAVLGIETPGVIATRLCVDALYSDIAGAKWNDSAATYNFPCDSKIEVSMVFGGQEFFIHPIDFSIPFIKDDGSISCSGTFVVHPQNYLSLGGTFLKNVYSLVFVGNLTPSGKGDPYMQFLSVTERDTAISEFPALNANRLLELKVLQGISQIVHSSAEPPK